MFQQKSSSVRKLGVVTGFTFSYALFTTILFFIFSFKHGKSIQSFALVLLITGGIMLLGIITKKLIK